MRRIALLLPVVLFLRPLGDDTPAAAPPTDTAEVLTARIWPIVKAKCLACHGDDAKKLRGGLDLRSRDSALRGGDSGKPAVVPGKPDDSPLYVAITRRDADLVMPPKENDRLTATEVELFRRWVAAGAPWPGKRVVRPTDPWTVKDGVRVRTSGGLSSEWDERLYRPADLWAYQPIRKPDVPTDIIDPTRVSNPIDQFIQARLKHKGITRLADPADRLTLLRRATFDLTGLPPTPDEVAAFLGDTHPGAFTRLIERLLGSPHHGEQQARHWLDVTRYADTNGFANDFERPAAWRYRDYVIRRFNQDIPFDRFIIEQLAGDELDLSERVGGITSPHTPSSEPEMLIATGFLRAGPWEHTGMTVAAITRQQFLDDVTHHVGVTFLGQQLRCAACHDHKFDPVPTRDYYRLQAVFATTYPAERPAAFLPVERTAGFTQAKAVVQARIDHVRSLQAGLRKKNEMAIAKFLQERGVKSIDDLPAGERPRKDYLGGTYGLTKTDLSLRKIYQKWSQYLARELARFEPHAFTVYCGADNRYISNKLLNPPPRKLAGPLPVVHILAGGSLASPGEAVTPGVLSAVFASNDQKERTAWNTIPSGQTGRRLALARWIASPQNTLTARVIVNRVWQQHFGTGLVATPNNFGKMGARPSHPDLLDWLASWFIEHGWSLKQLHRLIMTSYTYQQASRHPDMQLVHQKDAKNQLLAFFPARRLAAEELRDAMLAISGELNSQQGGPGVFPEINWEVALQPRHIMGSVAPAYLPSPTPAERNRRTIYTFRLRTLADPILEVFNRPGSETSCERRDETTVTPQVFALFNSAFAHQRALALAADIRSKSQAGKPELEVNEAFRRVYGRMPTATEREVCLAHVKQMTEHHQRTPPQRTELPTRVRRGMVEELTGEMVYWDEELIGLKGYQRDLMPWQVDPATRGLAELCLVLFNSSEFIYLR